MTAGSGIDILIPTRNRACALAMTLTALSFRGFSRLRIVISDQSDEEGLFVRPGLAAVLRLLKAQGRQVETHRHLPRRGMAEQRAFMLSRVRAPYCLFLDDDVLLESDMVAHLHRLLLEQGCGFVGSALHGLSFLEDVRPHQQDIEFWEPAVAPECVTPGSAAWERHHLHSAANLWHVQTRLHATAEQSRPYRIAWTGGCVLFDTYKLRAAGGFDFWEALPDQHCGEDVLAQLRVMEAHGGCGMFPSGAYHLEESRQCSAGLCRSGKLCTTLSAMRLGRRMVFPVRAVISVCACPCRRRHCRSSSWTRAFLPRRCMGNGNKEKRGWEPAAGPCCGRRRSSAAQEAGEGRRQECARHG